MESPCTINIIMSFSKKKKEPVFVRRVCEKNYIHPVLHLAVKSSFRIGLLHRRKFVQTDAHKSSSQVRQKDFEACQIVRIVCLFSSFIGVIALICFIINVHFFLRFTSKIANFIRQKIFVFIYLLFFKRKKLLSDNNIRLEYLKLLIYEQFLAILIDKIVVSCNVGVVSSNLCVVSSN